MRVVFMVEKGMILFVSLRQRINISDTKLTYLKIILDLETLKIKPIVKIFMIDFLSLDTKVKFIHIN